MPTRCTLIVFARAYWGTVNQEATTGFARSSSRPPGEDELRKQLAEHAFGTIKRAWNQGYFLTKGLESVNAEMGLTMLAYNIKRAIQVLGMPKMMEAYA